MGLLNLLSGLRGHEKKDKPAPTAKRKTNISIISNVKPAPMRGYMNLGRYSVVGTHPQTNRKRTVKIAAADEVDALVRSGLLRAQATEIGWEEPSDRQIAYASDIGLPIFKDITKDDISALLSRANSEDAAAVPVKLVQAAAKRGIAMSYLVGWAEYHYTVARNSDETVYTIPKGRRYHSSKSCPKFAGGREDIITLTEAEACSKGITRCIHCNWAEFDLRAAEKAGSPIDKIKTDNT